MFRFAGDPALFGLRFQSLGSQSLRGPKNPCSLVNCPETEIVRVVTPAGSDTRAEPLVLVANQEHREINAKNVALRVQRNSKRYADVRGLGSGFEGQQLLVVVTRRIDPRELRRSDRHMTARRRAVGHDLCRIDSKFRRVRADIAHG